VKIDINCDMGESFGSYVLGHDQELMPMISSANIACGFHAGDPMVMRDTVRLAKKNNVKVGAHPGYPDLQGFGRRSIEMTPEEVEEMVLYQIGALAAIARAEGVELFHVKPHGALYNQAAVNISLARAIAQAVVRYDRNLILFGLAGSQSIQAGVDCGLVCFNEGFPERGYNPDATLMSRKLPGAVIHSPHEVAENAYRLTINGIELNILDEKRYIKPDTLCVHGDNPNAVLICKALIQRLEKG
jgi:5-oxoprolinase (ATP-hydrolysing) subunit A